MPFRDAWLYVGGVLIVLGLAAEEPIIVAVGFVVVVIGAVSRYWAHHLFDRLTFKAELGERRTFVGEPVSLDIELSNQKPLPLPWYEWRYAVAGALPVEGEALSAAVAPGTSWIVRRGALSWYEQHAWQFTVSPGERGFFPIGPARIRSADLLGIFPRTHEIPDVRFLTVYPRVFPLEDLGLPSDRPFGDRRGRNPIFEDPIRIAGLREYRPGDPLKRIDWKATARSGELQSRVYDPSATQQLYLMVNIDTMIHPWEGYLRDELERIVSTTASVAVWAAGAKYAVGLLANGAFPEADRPIRLPPSRSREQLTKIMDALAVIQPLTMGDLAKAIQRESGRLPAGSTIVVIASLVPPSLAASMLRLVAEDHKVYALVTSEKAAAEVPAAIPTRVLADFAPQATAT